MATKRKPSWHDDEITAVAELARGFFDRELIANRSEANDPAKPLQLFSYASEKTIADIKA